MPLVSVIVPCYNEQTTIQLLLSALYAQTYPRSDLEVIIADGVSTDHTREQIGLFQERHPDLLVRVVDNLKRTIPAGLNTAIRAARGEIIVRLDAHSIPEPDYIARSVEALQAGRGDNIGGVWEIRPRGTGWIPRAIAAAAAHPLGVGDALYRYADRAQAVDTVPFGSFHCDLVQRIGFFDETLLTNEDYEFNTRIRRSGGTVWLDPAIRSVYLARANLKELAQQYWRYGFWKVRMLRRYPKSLRWRQALPPLFVLSLLVLSIAALFWPLARWLLAAELGIYALALLAAGVHAALQKQDPALVVGVPMSIATMHLSWGSAFLWSLLAGEGQPQGRN